MRAQLSVVWFYGVQPGFSHAIYPVYLIAEEPKPDQFVLALTDDQRTVRPGSKVEEAFRRYLIAETRRRLHQPVFASQVMLAYGTACALGHRELLDAAHIIPTSDPRGLPVVPIALALCKIHHAAYDQNILGIRPGYVVEIHHRLLEEVDGPMLRHGLQEHHAKPLMRVPRQRADRPDPAAVDGALCPLPRCLKRSRLLKTARRRRFVGARR